MDENSGNNNSSGSSISRNEKLGTPESIHRDAMIRQAELGEQLKYLRQTSHFSVKDLCQLTGMSKKTIWKLETGRSVNLLTLIKVLVATRHEIDFSKIGSPNERQELGI